MRETSSGLGGDTYITSETFHFGDYAVVDNTLYIYYGRNSANFTPSSITGAANFSRIPVMGAGNLILRTQLASGTPTIGYVPTATATGVEWAAGGLGTPLTNAQVEDETDAATTGPVSPSVLSHAVDVHESQFVRGCRKHHGNSDQRHLFGNDAGGRPSGAVCGGVAGSVPCPDLYTGFESNSARIHINVGEAGASDDVTANIRQLDGGGSHSWSDLETGPTLLGGVPGRILLAARPHSPD